MKSTGKATWRGTAATAVDAHAIVATTQTIKADSRMVVFSRVGRRGRWRGDEGRRARFSERASEHPHGAGTPRKRCGEQSVPWTSAPASGGLPGGEREGDAGPRALRSDVDGGAPNCGCHDGLLWTRVDGLPQPVSEVVARHRDHHAIAAVPPPALRFVLVLSGFGDRHGWLRYRLRTDRPSHASVGAGRGDEDGGNGSRTHPAALTSAGAGRSQVQILSPRLSCRRRLRDRALLAVARAGREAVPAAWIG